MRLLDAPAGLFVDRFGFDLLAVGQGQDPLAWKLAFIVCAVGEAETPMSGKLAIPKVAFIAADRLAVDVPGESALTGQQIVCACARPGDALAGRRIGIGGP